MKLTAEPVVLRAAERIASVVLFSRPQLIAHLVGRRRSVETPTIQTDRLLLRPFVRADAPEVFAYASNPRVSRFTSWCTHTTIADSEAFIEMVLTRPPDDHTWAICPATDPRVQGAIEFGLVAGAVAELHYVLAEPLWNRGLMTEAARAVLAWGLASYPMVTRVVSRAFVDNVASHRVMEHCGMIFERLRSDHMVKLGAPVDQLEYALTRQEVRRNSAALAARMEEEAVPPNPRLQLPAHASYARAQPRLIAHHAGLTRGEAGTGGSWSPVDR